MNLSRFEASGVLEKIRSIGLPVVLISSTAFFAWYVNKFYPFSHWLFLIYAKDWVLSLFWATSCTASGFVTVKYLLPRPLPSREMLMTSFAVGVFEFFLLMFVVGLLRGYGTVAFFALPLLLFACGARPLFGYLRRLWRHSVYRSPLSAKTKWWHTAVLVLGVLGALMVYFVILTPENAQFDSRWKHIALAEEYVAYGGIRRFGEGWTVATYPHLASFIYAWGFMLPGANLFEQVELAAHLEYTVFLASVLSIVPMVRLLVKNQSSALAWVVRFAFPGVFLYDSSVSLGADHVAALYVIPIFTVLVRVYDTLCPRHMVLLAMMMSGGIMVKYTSLMMLLPVPAAAIAFRSLSLLKTGWQTRHQDSIMQSPSLFFVRSNWYRGPFAILVAGLVFTSPLWLKNWVWYGDPLYPSLHKYLHLRPWTQDAADLFEWGYKDHQFWRPTHDFRGFLKTLWALLNFSFVPNDYPKYHGLVPVFGSLFTLSLFCLPFVRANKRVWGLFFTVHVSLFVWYWTHHQDRYLQTLLPWMAAATASVFLLVWQSGTLARVGLISLVSLQIIWGADVYFLQTHAMIKSPVKAVVDLIAAGHRKTTKAEYEARFHVFAPYSDIRKTLPKGATVLLHDNHVHTGLAANTVSDWGGWQFGISYGRLESPKDVYSTLKGLSVTHLLWQSKTSKGWDSLAGDIMFFNFALRYGTERKVFGNTIVAKMPTVPPSGNFNDKVAVLGCNHGYATGLYRVRELTVPVFGPKKDKYPRPQANSSTMSHDDLLASAGFAVLDTRCVPSLPVPFRTQFTHAANRLVIKGPNGLKKLEIWVRTRNVSISQDAEPTDGSDHSANSPEPVVTPTPDPTPSSGDEVDPSTNPTEEPEWFD